MINMALVTKRHSPCNKQHGNTTYSLSFVPFNVLQPSPTGLEIFSGSYSHEVSETHMERLGLSNFKKDFGAHPLKHLIL